jgi:hypothetical protein
MINGCMMLHTKRADIVVNPQKKKKREIMGYTEVTTSDYYLLLINKPSSATIATTLQRRRVAVLLCCSVECEIGECLFWLIFCHKAICCPYSLAAIADYSDLITCNNVE